jgi:hypothetical protein
MVFVERLYDWFVEDMDIVDQGLPTPPYMVQRVGLQMRILYGFSSLLQGNQLDLLQVTWLVSICSL